MSDAPMTNGEGTDSAVKRVVKGWAVLGNHGKLHVFGTTRGRGGSYSIFEKKRDALAMSGMARSWEIKRCKIIIE